MKSPESDSLSCSRVLLSLLFLFTVTASVHAVYLQVSAVGGPFTTDRNIMVIAKAYDDNSAAKNYIDLNTYVVKLADLNASNASYIGSVQGTAIRVIPPNSLASAGDYNVVAVDLNDSLTSQVTITVRTITGATAAFYPHNPPFNLGLASGSEDINFSLQAKSTSGDTNIFLRARLVSDANNSQAADPIDVNANGITTYAFHTTSLSQGLYHIDVNSGLSVVPVTLFQFKGFSDLQDDKNNSTTVFGQGKLVQIILKATNFDGNVSQTISSASVTVTSPSGDINSSVPCIAGSSYTCLYVVRSDANAGTYVVTGTITVNGQSIVTKKNFEVRPYQFNFFTKDFSGGDAGKMKMPSVYPANFDVNFEAHFTNTSTGIELSGNTAGSDLNGTFCQDQNMSVFIQNVGSSGDGNQATKTISWNSANPNYCLVKITAPSKQGTYKVTAKVPYAGQILKKSTILVVQNYLIFAMPVAPDSYDPNTPTGKFGFVKGESVGFNPSYQDLNGGLSPQIARVNSISIFDGTQSKVFTSPDVNWNTDKNIVTLTSSAVSSLSGGGFKPVTINVDVNAADANTTGITVFSMFKLSVLSMTLTVVDSNNPVTAAQKSEQFGPSSVGLDENIYLKVTILAGSTGVGGATVSLNSFRNMDTWQALDTTQISQKVTDTNGVAIMDIGKLQQRGLPSGAYLAEVKATTVDGNTDTADTFFQARRFSVFLQPVDVNSGDQCNFLPTLRRDQNGTFIIRAFNPNGGSNINVNIAPVNPLSLSFFGSPTKPLFPPSDVNGVNYDVNNYYPCMGPGGVDANYTMVTMRKANNATWTSGFYNVTLKVDANGGTFDGNAEIGHGFMNVQPFAFIAQPNTLNQFGPPTAKPGGSFDMNVTAFGADTNVWVTAKLVDPNGGDNLNFSQGGSNTTDLNIGVPNPIDVQNDCNAQRCIGKRVDIKVSRSTKPTDANVVRIQIPSNAKTQGYLVELSATDASGNTANSEVFVNLQLFKIVNFGWFNSLFGVFGLSNQAQPDWNTAGIRFNQAYQAMPQQGGGGPNAPPNIDSNFLVDYAGKTLVVDTNADRNFMYIGDANVSAGGTLTDANHIGYVITDISRVGSEEPGVKFIKKSALANTSSTFGYIGTYPADQNFTIPILVKNVDGTGADANVIVSNIGIYTPGNNFPTMLATSSCSTITQLQSCTVSNDFNSWNRETDINGFALIPVRVAKPGSNLMLELTVYTTNGTATATVSTQKLQPFEGPNLDIKKFTTSTLLAGPTFTLNYDTNYGVPGADLNVAGISQLQDTNIARYVGTAGNRNGILGDINSSLTWYFVKTADGNVWFDDDTNFSPGPGPPFMDGSVAEGGVYKESACTAFNSSCSIVNGSSGQSLPIYWNSAGVDSNIFDSNILFYPVYTNNFDPNNTVNKDANVQIAVSITNLDGTPYNGNYGISNARLVNFAFNSNTPVSVPAGYSNVSGTTLINVGNFASKGPGTYNLLFNLTINGNTTSEQAYFQVRS